jgi:hypothetical protein
MKLIPPLAANALMMWPAAAIDPGKATMMH